jgi:hypothetical protein
MEQQQIIALLKEYVVKKGEYNVYTGSQTDYTIAALVGGRVNKDHVLRLRVGLYGRSGPPRIPKFRPQPEQPAPIDDEQRQRGAQLLAALIASQENVVERLSLIEERLTLIGGHLGLCNVDGTKPEVENMPLVQIRDLLEKLLDLWGYSPKRKIDEAVAAVHKKS